MEVPTLRDLTLRGFELQESHTGALSLESSKVEKLSLKYCRLLGAEFMEGLRSNKTLTTLYLQDTRLNRDHCISLGNGLQHTTTLESLSLHNCFSEESPIENLGVVFSALGANKSLRCFEVYGFVHMQQFSPGLLRSLTLGLTE